MARGQAETAMQGLHDGKVSGKYLKVGWGRGRQLEMEGCDEEREAGMVAEKVAVHSVPGSVRRWPWWVASLQPTAVVEGTTIR